MTNQSIIGGMNPTELQTAVGKVFSSEWIAGIDYQAMSIADAQAYLDECPTITVGDVANDLVLPDDTEDYDDNDYSDDDYDGQPDEAQEWHDFDPDC